ncbi:MAG: iron uptake transporter deferrochelatase/peroxidase subunit [Acidimicrobiales bacterium]
MTLTRRRFLATAGAGAAGSAAALALPGCVSREAAAGAADQTVRFYGVHQAGITTPAQDRLHFAAFDITTDARAQLSRLLRAWTDAAAAMTEGRDVGEFGAMDGPYLAPPEDTGEAYGLAPARLTITFGFGPGLFRGDDGIDRFGLAAHQPEPLRPLPHFPGDNLDPGRSGGDLCIQACADDPQIAVHAIRNLARIGFGTVSVRWSQLGFGRTASTSRAQLTPRNLFGFKDGTHNLKAEDVDLLDQFVWVQPDDSAGGWLAGGSYLVARRIKMHIETWDRTSLQEQEAVIGRDKKQGAPLSGGEEFTAPDFTRSGSGSALLIAETAHLRVAHPDQNAGVHILRRGYNFADGTTSLGHLDAGLFFIAYTRDPDHQFIPLQANLARDDALNEYIQHTGSGIFAVPPGASEDRYVGQSLFEA